MHVYDTLPSAINLGAQKLDSKSNESHLIHPAIELCSTETQETTGEKRGNGAGLAWTKEYPHCQTDFQQHGVGSRWRKERCSPNLMEIMEGSLWKTHTSGSMGCTYLDFQAPRKKALIVISVIPMGITNSFTDEVIAWIKLSPTWFRAKVPTYLIQGQPRASLIHGQRPSSVLKLGVALVALQEPSATGCRYPTALCQQTHYAEVASWLD